MLGCNESNVIFQQHLCKLGQLRRSNVRNSQVFGQASNLWPPHFRTFCELVEGEENKLTTWTIMLGCNESDVIFQQHLCKLGQLRRSNGRNSQVLVQAMKKRPTGHYTRSIHTSRGETLHLLPAAGWGAVSLIHQLREREHCCSRSIHARAARAILSRDRTVDDEIFCTALPIHLRVYTICG